jgi:hypothetical protein
MGRACRIGLVLALLANLAGATPPEDEVWKAVEAAGLPQALVVLKPAAHFSEAMVIGRTSADGQGHTLNSVYWQSQYLSPNQATGQVVGVLTPELATAWVTEVLLAFEQPCLKCPTEMVGSLDFFEPSGESEGAGFKVRLWVREPKGGFSLRQYHLTKAGFRLTVQQRLRP